MFKVKQIVTDITQDSSVSMFKVKQIVTGITQDSSVSMFKVKQSSWSENPLLTRKMKTL